MSRARKARAVRAASRPMREHAVHAAIFAGICVSTVLAHLGMQDAALALSIAVNGVWVFHG